MKAHLRDIIQCVRCGRCRTVCPVQQVLSWESTGARGRMQMALGLATGLEPTEGMVRSLLTCTTCRKCVTECPSGADPQKVTQAARRTLIGLGRSAPHQQEMRDRIYRTGNSLGDELSRRSWLSGSTVSTTSGYVYFAGCLASYRDKTTADTTYRILKTFGVNLLEDERCCGSPLFRLGIDASDLIEHNTRQVETMGAHTVIVGCAGCYSMFREKYSGFDVVHISEFIADRLDQIPLRQLDIAVTYHDPCHLGRTYGIYEPPRNIIERIGTLMEMTGENCCGGGGGVRLGYPGLSGSMAEDLAKKIPENVEYMVTSCPLCARNLSDAGIPVIDLAELIWMAIPEDQRQNCFS